MFNEEGEVVFDKKGNPVIWPRELLYDEVIITYTKGGLYARF